VARGAKAPAPIAGLRLEEVGHLADLVAPFAAAPASPKRKTAAA
jgi:DNA repair protein RadA/Sms